MGFRDGETSILQVSGEIPGSLPNRSASFLVLRNAGDPNFVLLSSHRCAVEKEGAYSSAIVRKETSGLRWSYALKNRPFSTVSYSLGF